MHHPGIKIKLEAVPLGTVKSLSSPPSVNASSPSQYQHFNFVPIHVNRSVRKYKGYKLDFDTELPAT